MPHSTNEVHAGDAKYEDLNGDGNITDEDYQVLGNAFPVLSGSLSFNFEYFGFDFQVFFQGVWGNKIYNALRERTEGNGLTNQLSTDMRDVFIYYNEDTRLTMEDYGLDWQGYMEQYSGNIPNPCSTNPKNNETSSRFLEDGSYLRLKNITLGYTLPKAVTQKAKINRLRFYVTANNLLTLTKYSGYDPEVGSGVDYGNYPQARTVMFGLNLDF